MDFEKFMREKHDRAYEKAQSYYTDTLRDEEIEELLDSFSSDFGVTKPDWEVLPFEVGNPDPIYALNCECDLGGYYKERRRIEFYVRPDIKLALHEFTHHLIAETLNKLRQRIEPDLSPKQLETLEKIINEIDPGVDPNDSIELFKKMPEQEIYRNIREGWE